MRSRRAVLVLALLLVSIPAAWANPGPAPSNPPVGAIVAPASATPASIRATLRLPGATWINDHDQNKVFDSLEARFAASPGERQETVVTLRYGADADDALAAARSTAGPFEPTHVFRALGGFIAHLTEDQALAIARLPQVRQVEWAQPGTPELDTATRSIGVDTVQDQLRIDGDLDGKASKFTGDDVLIAIMDTGFDGVHVDLAGKFVKFIDWNRPGVELEPNDPDGHGTHVASIAAGLGKGDPLYKGVAPGASLLGFQITVASGVDCTVNSNIPGSAPCGTKAAVLSSIDWILENRKQYPVDISTISFGFGVTTDGTDALELGFDRLFEVGILPFKSNGNSGPEHSTVTIPGGARGIVSVAALNDPQPIEPESASFFLTQFSSRGPTADGRIKPDLAAPGNQIMAAGRGTVNRYVPLSGTSMASPFAAGVAALVMDANPRLTNAQVRDVLYKTTEDWGPKGRDVDFGHGRIDALAAVQEALRTRKNVKGPEIPDHAIGKLKVAVGEMAQVEITVTDDKFPITVTAIAQRYEDPPVGDQKGRLLLMELMSPGEQPNPAFPIVAQSTTIAQKGGTARQYWNSEEQVDAEGTYLFVVYNLGRADDVVVLDVSGSGVRIRK